MRPGSHRGDGLGWPQPRIVRVEPRLPWLRYALPGTVQVVWIGTVHPRLLATLFALEGPAEFGQGLIASLRHRDIELLVLRATWNAGHFYHYSAHALWARIRERRGFLDAVTAGPEHARWDERQACLLRAADELHDDMAIGAPTVRRLREFGYGDRELIEICFIVAHYQLLGMLEESAGMPPEPLLGRPRTTAEMPRRPRKQRCDPRPDLEAHTPWTPGGDAVLSRHPALHAILSWYGRRMARLSTLDGAEIGAALDDSVPDAADSRALVIDRAVDELDREFFLSDTAWQGLLVYFTVREILELCVLVGHYRTYAMIVATLEAH